MKNIKGIIVGIVLFGILVAGIIYWQANQEVTDPTTVDATVMYISDDLMKLSDQEITNLEGQIIAVTGMIQSNESDQDSRTIGLGSNEMEVVICQMDNRYLAGLDKLNHGQLIKLKGELTGHDFDEMLGKTIQMKNCVPDRKN